MKILPGCRGKASTKMQRGFFTQAWVHELMAYGMVYGMKLRMDNAGRIVLPKPLRKRLGLQSDGEFEVVEQADGILLRPQRPQPAMVRVRGFWVHQGVPEPGTDWDRVVDDVREERIQTIINPR